MIIYKTSNHPILPIDRLKPHVILILHEMEKFKLSIKKGTIYFIVQISYDTKTINISIICLLV